MKWLPSERIQINETGPRNCCLRNPKLFIILYKAVKLFFKSRNAIERRSERTLLRLWSDIDTELWSMSIISLSCERRKDNSALQRAKVQRHKIKCYIERMPSKSLITLMKQLVWELAWWHSGTSIPVISVLSRMCRKSPVWGQWA